MPEEIKTAETTVNTEVDSHADVTETSESLNDADFADTAKDEQDEPKPQTKEQNSQNARRRREAERQAELKRAADEAREKAIIETLGGKNPYTNEDMKDSADVKEYLTMREIEKNGGDPLSDFAKYHKKQERERAEQEQKQKDKENWYINDRADFIAKYPEVNIDELISDEDFVEYADGKAGEIPLAKIYEGYAKFTAKYEKKAKQIATQRVANQKASPGSLSSTNPSDSGFYTKEQVEKMSTEEIKKDYDKVRASMARWK